ncbi:MAG: preprotein translocase subunit SecY [Phycisphaeraceae bacterium]|nr:preprotein translocase subunit SecY [Phycisphaeraceae bacterium]
MFQAFINMWKIAELRTKLLFTLGMLAIYRIGFFIALPGVDQSALTEYAERAQREGSGAADLMMFVSVFTGGSFSQSTIFGLGIMPYISASIIFQLLATVVPSLQQLQKEGQAGRTKIQEYTRYATVGLCLVQAMFMLSSFTQMKVVDAEYASSWIYWTCGVVGLTAGTSFLMWLGEQIDKFGIGNGASLIITAGIVTGMPMAIQQIASNFSVTAGSGKPFSPMTVIFLAIAFISVVAGAIIITQGQRRIPIQQAKHTRGRRVYGGQRSYLPLRVNHGGVMPIIFASALMMFPTLLIGWLAKTYDATWLRFISDGFDPMRGYMYILCYVGLIYFFAYFWTTVQFQPKEMATNLRDHGSFIPGLRPGPRTADYLETVMERITYVGAGFLAVIAVIPMVVAALFDIPLSVTVFLGGTGLLIVVSVMLDFVQRIEAAMLMRNYGGFLGGPGGGKRIRSGRG